MGRTILHSDMNSFYASVEILLDPALKGKPVAVCGATEDRHGIVLAKSEQAKRAGVKTGMVNHEAVQLCPDLILVPPQYDQYIKYSNLARKIYESYTDLIEPFGMDECWLDVTGSEKLFGTGREIAEEIRQRMKEEIGLTVSIGVSFNKVFAKLGSDMKKPDAVTEITEENFKEKVWGLPADELIYVGRATMRKLSMRSVYTIGDLANVPEERIRSWFGVNGLMIRRFARGEDTSRVMHMSESVPIKSIGHGITCNADLISNEEVFCVLYELSQDVSRRLRLSGFLAGGVQIFVRASDLTGGQFQTKFPYPSRSPLELAKKGFELFRERYFWIKPVRSLTIRAIALMREDSLLQPDFFMDTAKILRRDRLEETVERIRERYGKNAIRAAVLMRNLKMPDDGRDEVRMPGMMYN